MTALLLVPKPPSPSSVEIAFPDPFEPIFLSSLSESLQTGSVGAVVLNFVVVSLIHFVIS